MGVENAGCFWIARRCSWQVAVIVALRSPPLFCQNLLLRFGQQAVGVEDFSQQLNEALSFWNVRTKAAVGGSWLLQKLVVVVQNSSLSSPRRSKDAKLGMTGSLLKAFLDPL